MKCSFFNEKVKMNIWLKFSLKSPINNKQALVQIHTWRLIVISFVILFYFLTSSRFVINSRVNKFPNIHQWVSLQVIWYKTVFTYSLYYACEVKVFNTKWCQKVCKHVFHDTTSCHFYKLPLVLISNQNREPHRGQSENQWHRAL